METFGDSVPHLAAGDLSDLRRSGVAIDRRLALARHVLNDRRLRRDSDLRLKAVAVVVSSLPATFAVVEDLLSDCSSPLWHEVHFEIFGNLDRSNLSEDDQRRVVDLLERYLMEAKSEAGFAAWKAGDHLGDEWYSPETVDALERAIVGARFVAGRLGALHGIEHAIDNGDPETRKRLWSLLRRVARKDRSRRVHRKAKRALAGGGCARVAAPAKTGKSVNRRTGRPGPGT